MEKTRGRGRPPVTTREAVEDVALALFEQRGMENTTVVDIAEACSMSKTSFFRYFASKNEILWGPFEAHVQRLEESLANEPEDKPIIDALRENVRAAVELESSRSDAWLRRFKFQNTQAQQPLSLMYWGMWEKVVADFVRKRSKAAEGSLIPEAVAGTLRAAFRAFLRHWVISGNTRIETLLPDFDKSLDPVFAGISQYVSCIPCDSPRMA